jgi:hypothetical protein
MHVDTAGGLPGLLWIGAVDGAGTPQLTNQTDQADVFLNGMERQTAEAVDGALLTLLNKLVTAHSSKPRLTSIPILQTEEQEKELTLSRETDEVAGDPDLHLSSAPLLFWNPLSPNGSVKEPQLHSGVNADGDPDIRVFPVDRTPDLFAKNPTLSSSDLKKGDNRGKVPALTNLRPTLFSEPLRKDTPESTNGEQLYADIAGDDAKAPQRGKRVDTPALNNAPDVFKKEHAPVLSSAVADNRGGTYEVIADENGTTLTVPGKEVADPVPSLFHSGGKKENRIPTKVLPSLRGPAPEPLRDSLFSEVSPRLRLLSLSPALHSEKGEVKESPSESEKPSLRSGEGKRFPLPFNLTPELHSALKRYGRVVSAEVLSLREYAQKLLSKGTSVEEIVKILNSMGEESPHVSLPEEHKRALFQMVQNIRSALEGLKVEDALLPLRDVTRPALFSPSPELLARGENPTFLGKDEVGGETPGGGGIGERGTSALRPESVRGDLAPVMTPPAMLSEVGGRQPVPVSAQPTLWHSVAERLARLMESDQVKTLELRLDPPELGRVHLTVHAWGNRIDAEISVSHGEVRQYLEAHREQIAMALQSRGLELASLTVSSQGRQGGFEDYGFSQGLTWSAPLPLSEVPLLVGLPLATSSGGLDVRA